MNNNNINDDGASTLESVCNGAIEPEKDALFDENIETLHADIMDEDNDANDENILTQINKEDINININDMDIKPRDWSRRARKIFSFFKRKEGKEFSFNQLMESQTKRETVAGVFYELLVFKNSDLVDLKQNEPFDDITITKTDNFYRNERLRQRL